MKKENGKGDEPMASNYIRFDWAMKRLLRNKANFAVLEGFLTTLLNEKANDNVVIPIQSQYPS